MCGLGEGDSVEDDDQGKVYKIGEEDGPLEEEEHMIITLNWNYIT